VEDHANAEHRRGAAEAALPASRQSNRWKSLWPVYCVGIGIVLILVGALV